MKSFVRIVMFFALVLAFAGLGYSQDNSQPSSASQSAKQDMKDAGHSTKNAAKSTGHAAKKTGHTVKKDTKKATNKSAKKTKQAAQKVQDKTDPSSQDSQK